jgi:hypothetical protein
MVGKNEMKDDSARGNAQAVYGENGKAGLPMEGDPLTTDADGKLVPMPTYRTDIGKGTWYQSPSPSPSYPFSAECGQKDENRNSVAFSLCQR